MGMPPYGLSLFNGSSIPLYDVPFNGGSAYHYNYNNRLSAGSPYRPLHISVPPPYAGGSMLRNGGIYGMRMPLLMDRYGLAMPMGGPPPMVTYIVRGSGRFQVVGVDGWRVLETTVKAGNLFIVPRFYVVSKICNPGGMDWFSIITTPNPIFTHLAGRTSVWKALSPEVLEASFGVSSEVEQLFQSKRTSYEIFFPPSNGVKE